MARPTREACCRKAAVIAVLGAMCKVLRSSSSRAGHRVKRARAGLCLTGLDEAGRPG